MRRCWNVTAPMDAQLRGIMKVINLKKSDKILMPAMPVNRLWFVDAGLLVLKSETEQDYNVLDFWDVGDYALMASEFMDGVPNDRYMIESLEDCRLVAISKEAFRPFMDTFPEAHIIMEKIAHRKSRRRLQLSEINKLPHLERYTALDAHGSMFKHMNLKVRISHELLANALGVSKATISRSK